MSRAQSAGASPESAGPVRAPLAGEVPEPAVLESVAPEPEEPEREVPANVGSAEVVLEPEVLEPAVLESVAPEPAVLEPEVLEPEALEPEVPPNDACALDDCEDDCEDDVSADETVTGGVTFGAGPSSSTTVTSMVGVARVMMSNMSSWSARASTIAWRLRSRPNASA